MFVRISDMGDGEFRGFVDLVPQGDQFLGLVLVQLLYGETRVDKYGIPKDGVLYEIQADIDLYAALGGGTQSLAEGAPAPADDAN